MKKYTMNVTLGALCLCSGLVWGGCQEDRYLEATPQQEVTDPAKKNPTSQGMEWLPGEAFVKLKKSAARAATATVLEAVETQVHPQELKMEPVFEIAGEYAEALRREGLDRWYKVTFDEQVQVEEVLKVLENDAAVERVHGSLAFERSRVEYTPLSGSRSSYPNVNEGYLPFPQADPFLPQQWHYANNGQGRGFEQGADINLFKAWEKTTGDKRVVVAIIDSGVDFSHPDLQGSEWSDKDGHHGKNFVDNNFELEPDYHGTHVGGTIGARNNNGIGVCGIAGGDGTPSSGVRLMSCQIFGAIQPNGSSTSAKADQIAKAFIWAVENGAVLANCSWGFPWNPDRYANAEDYKQSLEKAGALVLEGIRFFNKYAGNDKDGKKKADSMMSGGLVIFASGNDSSRDIDIIPASYDEVVSVGSFTPNYSLARYTNVGKWVDILAPGGLVEDFVHGGVLSTVPSNFGDIQIGIDRGSKFLYAGQRQYAFANGTSMAAPHVTGVAALMVSYFGNKDKNLTSDVIRKRLLGAIKAQSLEKASKDVSLQGKMGVGFIDAGYALSDAETQAPAAVQAIEVNEVSYYDAKIAWKVTADADAPTGTAFAYDVFVGEQESTAEANRVGVVFTHERTAGEPLEFALKELESNRKYVVTVVARDRFDNRSKAATASLTTLLNHKPQLVNPLPENLQIPSTKPFFKHSFEVKDEDPNQTWTFETSELPKGVTLVRNGHRLDLTILVNGQVGPQAFDLVLTDNLQGKQVEKIAYSIVAYEAPQVVGELKDLLLFDNGEAVKVNLDNVFHVAEGLGAPTFEVRSNVPEVVSAQLEGSAVVIRPLKQGSATVIVVVKDGQNQAQASFQVQVSGQHASHIHAIYPAPAHSYLKILMKAGIEQIDVKVTTFRGEVCLQQTLAVSAKDQVATLDVDRLAPGMYNLIVKSGDTVSKRTFIKN